MRPKTAPYDRRQPTDGQGTETAAGPFRRNMFSPPRIGVGNAAGSSALATITETPAMVEAAVLGLSQEGGSAHPVVEFTMPFAMSIRDVAAVLHVSVFDLVRWNRDRFPDLTVSSVLAQNDVVVHHQPPTMMPTVDVAIELEDDDSSVQIQVPDNIP